MEDREMLERAASLMNFEIRESFMNDLRVAEKDGATVWWNPLSSDADALQMAVKLGLDIVHGTDHVFVGDASNDRYEATEYKTDNPYEATRRAIVRAATAMYNVKVRGGCRLAGRRPSERSERS